jgi:hypothetical protein
MNSAHSTNKTAKKRRPKTTPARVRKRLEDKLLSLGGSKVIWQGNDPHATLIAARGQVFPQRVRMRRGDPNRCHANAAEIWAGATDKYQLVTGYALSNDHWSSHSWVIDGKTLYETTHRFDRYFGVVLVPFLALKFWFENFFPYCCPDKQPPPGFWEEYPGIVALSETLAKLPPKEFYRVMTAYLQGHSPDIPTAS